jgi:hypothetical protein
VRGTLRFDASKLPNPDRTASVPPGPGPTVLDARIEGVALGPNGRREARSYDLRLSVSCAGPWCARPRPGDALAFLRRDGNTYWLETNPCGGFLFNRPDHKTMRAIQNCLNAKPCPASKRR